MLNRSSLVFQGVGNGEYPLGISLEYAGPLWASNGAPVKTIYPADGTLALMEGVAVIKGGPNPDAAKKFVDYVKRKDVREMILKATFRRPARQDLDLSTLPGDMPPLASLKLLEYDEEGWTRSAPRRSRSSRTSSRRRAERARSRTLTFGQHRDRSRQPILRRRCAPSTTSRSPSPTASSSRCSGPPAAARPRCCA